MDNTTEQGITVELESAVGPRVLYPTTASAEDVEDRLPEGWEVSWETTTGRVYGPCGRWSAPLVRTLAWQVTQELQRLDAGGADGIEVADVPGEPGQVCLRDAEEAAYVNAARALELLRALPDGAGIEATWQALAELCS